MSATQHNLERHEFGRLDRGSDKKLLTITLPADAWHCLLVAALGQKLSTIGRETYEYALLEILARYHASDEQ